MRRWSACALVALCVLLSAQSLAQDATTDTAPTPAPEANQLPPVEVIQKAEPAPKAAQKKAAPKKKQVVAPAPQPPPAPPAAPVTAQTPGTGGIDTGTVMTSPVPGSAIAISKFPGAVGRASSADIQKFGDASVPEVLQNTVPSATIGDAQGNAYQRNLQYRGFEASPVNGVAQGLAVYQNGVRINESFGDIVNWDFLPDNAIDGITIIGANPVYGLNALGGAVAVVMRDGFNFQGVEIDSRFGSFGHMQGSLAAGARSGNWGAFFAGELIEDDGYRDFSEAQVRRMYADIGVKGDGVELHLNFTAADNLVGVTAAAPELLLDLGWNRTFTSPQTTDNELSMLSMNGSVEATSTLTFSGVGYYRWFKQKHVDGNIAEGEECLDDPATAVDESDFLCIEDDEPDEGLALDQDGNPIPLGPGDTVRGVDLEQLGTLDRTSQDAHGYGGALQAVEKTPLFGLPNQFLIGASYDRGEVKYGANSELGFIGPKLVVNSFDPPIFLTGPDDVRPRKLTTTNDYAGLYFTNTLDVTRLLAVTVGGRYNYARIAIENQNVEPGEEDKLTGVHEYYRFNPMGGATYQLLPGMTLYGSYAEANRAPTAAELACADPEDPCLIESFLTADPPLKQVVSRTFELGLRGKLATFANDEKLEWTAGLFRTENQDDIIAVASPQTGRGFFQNAGDTLRQGVEAGVVYQTRQWIAYANYAFVDATFETAIELSSPDNPVAVPCTADPLENCVNVQPGDRLPGVPQHRFKTGFDFWVTPQWKIGADLVAVSDQVFFGDEGNDDRTLDGYTKVDIRTAYNVTENFQIYGMIDNVFDTRYGLFGNYFDTELANNAAQADGLPAGFFDSNPRTITPAPPVAAYGGVKLRF